MAKQKGIISLSGKIGDMVFSKGKDGKHVRTTPTLTDEQRKAKGQQPQNKRLAARNPVARTLNSAVKHYAGTLKSSTFYRTLQKKMGNAKTTERTLMLRKLYPLEVNPSYLFENACFTPNLDVKICDETYTIEAEIFVPDKEYKGNNSINLEFILFVFEKGKDECRHASRYTSWIRVNEGRKKYVTLEFPRTQADTDYIIACKAAFGVNCHDGRWSDSVMKLLTGNAVTEEGLRMIAMAEMKEPETKKVVAEKVRLEVRDER